MKKNIFSTVNFESKTTYCYIAKNTSSSKTFVPAEEVKGFSAVTVKQIVGTRNSGTSRTLVVCSHERQKIMKLPVRVSLCL